MLIVQAVGQCDERVGGAKPARDCKGHERNQGGASPGQLKTGGDAFDFEPELHELRGYRQRRTGRSEVPNGS